MTLTSLLSEIGYSEEFIAILEKSFADDFYNNSSLIGEPSIKMYDSSSCYIEESVSPVFYEDFSEAGGNE